MPPSQEKVPGKGAGFKHTTKQYEPDLSDEALEKMVPPPKRRIGEDTPLVDMSQQHAGEYSLANYTGAFAQNRQPI